MKKLSIRNELFLKLKKASLLINEESEEGRQGLDWKDSNDQSYVSNSKRNCDYQEIYFGNPYFLLKYVILLKDRTFFDEFCHVFDISNDIYKDTLQLLELKTGLINQNQGIISIIDDILLGNSSISSVKKEDTSLLNAPLFKGFTELSLIKVNKYTETLLTR